MGFTYSARHPELVMLVNLPPLAVVRRSDRDASSEVQSHLRAVAGNALTSGGPRVRRK